VRSENTSYLSPSSRQPSATKKNRCVPREKPAPSGQAFPAVKNRGQEIIEFFVEAVKN
jgi:hypothetical protein